MSLKVIHGYLFRAFLFFLPFQLGAFYTHLLDVDLIYAFDATLGLLYAVWIAETRWFRRRPIYWGGLTIPWVLLLIWTCLSFVNAISLTMAGIGVYMIVKAFLIYLYMINNIRTKARLRVAVNWVLGGMLFQGFLGIVQYTTGSSLGLEFAGAVFKGRSESGLARIRGTLGIPNQFGAWLALIFPLGVSLFIFELERRRKLYYGLSTLFGAFALLLTFSRSAWAGVIGGMLFFLAIVTYKRLLKVKYIVAMVLGAIVLAGVVIYFWSLIQLRFETGATGKYRLIMANIALELFKENPIFGVGLHNYRFHSMQYFRFWQPVHNTYLRLLTETGLPGLLFFIWLVLRAIRETLVMLRSRDRLIFSVALGTFCCIVAFLTAIQFGPEYHHYRVKVLFWVVLGIVFSLRKAHLHSMKAMKVQRERKLAVQEQGRSEASPPAAERHSAESPSNPLY